MDWVAKIFQPQVLALLIPVIAIIAVFGNKALKAHHQHQERMEKIRNGIDPDANTDKE
ncbi:hypothetical protein [Thalassotalea sp. ND16A]|uniref:hypothetical protein n=1 Tax=Thalassotalea sp. ND16A TaxID=1535422 RepID=UPI00051D156B|nr:hypothetical protein [Thalassotalea sp. ND16A]KGJ89336.1 hypothetical protein ND16A_2229 [Thalassotalea sp. ND16A]